MKNLNKTSAPPSSIIVSSMHQHVFDHDSLTNNDILLLQEKFLSNGFQYIKVKNLNSGRLIINRFITSLRIYCDMAVVTNEELEPKKNIYNIYNELLIGGYLNPFELGFMEEFFVEEFYFDFLWIEANEKLLKSSWYQHFEKKLIAFKCDQNIPIITLFFQD